MTVHTHLLAEAGVPMIEAMDFEVLAGERLWTHAFVMPANSRCPRPAPLVRWPSR